MATVARRIWNLPGTHRQVVIIAEDGDGYAVVQALNKLMAGTVPGSIADYAITGQVIASSDFAVDAKLPVSIGGVTYFIAAKLDAGG